MNKIYSEKDVLYLEVFVEMRKHIAEVYRLMHELKNSDDIKTDELLLIVENVIHNIEDIMDRVRKMHEATNYAVTRKIVGI